MADIYITEYSRLGVDQQGREIFAGLEPAVAEQKISNPATSTQSNALNEQTTFVAITASAAAHIKFGADPTATTGTGYIGSGETRLYAVKPNSSLKIAAINAS